jgi:ABC-type glycerol-3-phosphate transport system substrate-binding protein
MFYRTKRIVLTVVLSSCLLFSAYAACVAESVSFWTQKATNPTMLAILEEFTQETGINVELKYIDFTTDAIYIGLASGVLPDIFTHGGAAIGAFGALNFLLPLEPILDEFEFIKDMIPQVKTAGQYEGKQVAIAWNGITVRDLIYRVDILAEMGVSPAALSQSWNSFIQNGRKLVQRNADGSLRRSAMNIPKTQTWAQQFFMILQSQYGGSLLKDGLPALNDGTAVQALQLHADLIHVHQLDAFGHGGNLATGTTASMWGGWGDVKTSVDAGHELGITHLPYEKQRAAFFAADWIAIPEDAQNRTGAIKLLEYLLHPERQKRMNREMAGGALPFYRSAMQWDWVKATPPLEKLFDASLYGVPNPSHPLWFEMRDVLVATVSAAVRQSISPQAAMEQAQTLIMELLRQ